VRQCGGVSEACNSLPSRIFLYCGQSFLSFFIEENYVHGFLTVHSSIFRLYHKSALALVRIEVVAAIIRKDDKILITLRPDNVHLARLWEFPGGKVEAGESLQMALRREIREELGIEIRVDDKVFTLDYDYPTRSVRLHFFNCSVIDGDAQPLKVADLQWVNPHEIVNYEFPPADAELINILRASP
jgi:8-oxo-dGTP diphosphatase